LVGRPPGLVARLRWLRVRGRLVGDAGPARHAAARLCRLPGYDLKIIRTEEPDEDALAAVVPGHTRHYRDVRGQADRRGLRRPITGPGRRRAVAGRIRASGPGIVTLVG
jgi:hypothetical protein